MPDMYSTCRSCGAPVIWVAHETTGKRAPLDARPDPKGNLAIDGGTYYVVAPELRAQHALIDGLYTSHFATCPKASSWRAKGKQP